VMGVEISDDFTGSSNFRPPKKPKDIACNFCGKSRAQAKSLVSGRGF
jgi:hypothetical protein